MKSLAVGALVLLFFFPLAPLAQELKTAVVDLDRILVESAQGKAASERFREARESRKTQVGDLESEIETLQERYRTQEALLSESKKTEYRQEMERKRREYYELLQTASFELNRTRQQELEVVEETVKPIIHEIAEKDNYDFIFSRWTGLVYFKPSLDITNDILRRLDELHRADQPAEEGN